MFAGKTSHLIKTVNDLITHDHAAKDAIILVNHSSDSRYDTNRICSHDGCKLESLSLASLSQLSLESGKCKYLFIDEAQFFPDLYDGVLDIMKNYRNQQESITIYVYGLDGDFQQKAFQQSRLLELIPFASSITKLLARCYVCNAAAPFSKRLIETTSAQILVGGENIYQSACFNHLNV